MMFYIVNTSAVAVVWVIVMTTTLTTMTTLTTEGVDCSLFYTL